ncbi:hypothetical protein [Primorskyibacter flagellatus]|nr:hypothetical protein [Primorskyibacter flagellatus]
MESYSAKRHPAHHAFTQQREPCLAGAPLPGPAETLEMNPARHVFAST